MFYAKIVNGNVVSYPCTESEIQEGNCVVVQMTQMPECTIEQTAIFDGIECINDVWQQKWKIENAPLETVEKRKITKAKTESMTANEIASILG